MATRTHRIAALCLVLALVSGISLQMVSAQDSMTHVCDSTLITLLYVAENDYGFHSMTDVSTFEKGQYAPLFDAMMSMMGDDMMTEEAMMEDEMMATEEMMSDEMMATEEMMGDDMMGVTLTPGAVANEDPACTALRQELDSFFYDHFSMEMMG